MFNASQHCIGLMLWAWFWWMRSRQRIGVRFPMSRMRMLSRGVRLSRRGATLARWGVVGASLRALLGGNRIFPKLAARMTSGSRGSGVTDRLVGELRKLPAELWPIIAWHWSQEKNFEGMARHLECLPASARRCQPASWIPRCLSIALVAASASVAGCPRSWKVIRAERSGHWIQLDRPDLVLSAVREMVVGTRNSAASCADLQFAMRNIRRALARVRPIFEPVVQFLGDLTDRPPTGGASGVVSRARVH